MRHITALLTASVAIGATSSDTLAASSPEQSVVYQNLTAGRANPAGLLEMCEFQYKVRLFESDNPLFANNFVSFGLRPALTPAWGRVAGIIRLQPLSILQISAEYGSGGHFGSFGLMQSFPTADVSYSDTDRDRREEAGENYATAGSQIALGALLQLKVGPVAARSAARFIRPNHDLREGDSSFYDVIYDIVIPNRGWAVNTDTDLLYVSDFGLAAGLRWTMTHAFTSPSDFQPAVESSPNAPLHRVGPLFAYTFFKEPGASFDQPTLILIANWWLKHPHRTGQDTSQAMPYLIIGFRFQGELWSQD